MPTSRALAAAPRKQHTDLVESTFASRLTYALNARGMSGRRLAHLAGFSHSLMAQYTSGKLQNPTVETVSAICAALKISQKWLVYGQGNIDDPNDIPVAPPRRVRTYGDLPEWRTLEDAARAIVPHLAWALVGLRTREIDEEPKRLTAAWVAYRAERFEHEESTDEVRAAQSKEARLEARERAKATAPPTTTESHSVSRVRQSGTPGSTDK